MVFRSSGETAARGPWTAGIFSSSSGSRGGVWERAEKGRRTNSRINRLRTRRAMGEDLRNGVNSTREELIVALLAWCVHYGSCQGERLPDIHKREEIDMKGMLRGRALQAVSLAVLPALLCVTAAQAASPASGNVSGSTTQASWTGGPLTPTAASTCRGPNSPQCDNYKLTIAPPSYSFQVKITLTLQPTDDYDLEVYAPDGSLVGSSGSAVGQAETVILTNPPAGTYTVSASPYVPLQGYQASAKLSQIQPPPASTEPPPTYANYTPPDGMGTGAGEPSIGFNRDSGKAMYIAGLQTLRVTFNGCSSPATAKWEDVSSPLTSTTSLDPILY